MDLQIGSCRGFELMEAGLSLRKTLQCEIGSLQVLLPTFPHLCCVSWPLDPSVAWESLRFATFRAREALGGVLWGPRPLPEATMALGDAALAKI